MRNFLFTCDYLDENITPVVLRESLSPSKVSNGNLGHVGLCFSIQLLYHNGDHISMRKFYF